jgi:hypothetical protein
VDNRLVRLSSFLLVAVAAGLVLGLAACGGSSPPSYTFSTGTTTPGATNLPPGVTSSTRASATFANTPMSRLVLSGRLRPPAGFTVVSVNPIVPTSGPAIGAVAAVVMSPTSVEYDVTFSPQTVPCLSPSCTSVTRSLPVGLANPTNAQAVFSPEVGISAECGYDPDGHQIGCDAVVKDEYIAVRAGSLSVSTADAVAVLRAAIAYVRGLKPS